MPYNSKSNLWELSDLMLKLTKEKTAGMELQKRKHEDWVDNYELYRNKVKTNRLTQRQAVNIPLMKETIKTLLAKIDNSPNVEWKELAGDEYKEMVFQEVWNEQFKENNMELIDILDKKNVLLYGHSFKMLNIGEKGVNISVLDPYDVYLDPLTNVWDIESARFIVRNNVFRTVRDIIADEKYSKSGKDELKIWADSPVGMLQGEKNKEQWELKMERLRSMGVDNGDFPYYAGGDMLVNLSEHFTTVWNGKKFERRVIVYANDTIELYNETLYDCLGVDFWPFVYWSEDPENTDIYPDSVADLVRTPNKVLNVWFSQLIENRTLKNFQMHWYMPGQDYTPQTYTPGPGMMLPAPPGDDISKVIKPVEISGLDDTLTAIQTLTQIVERGTGATAIEKGESDQGQQTLGEVQILVGKAMERTTGMAKFYRIAWYELAKKWYRMIDANAPKFFKLYKTSGSGKIYPKTVYKSDWKSEAGYEPVVSSTSEQEAESIKSLQKWQFVTAQNPTNPALRKISMKRQLESLDLTPQELKEVEEAEDKQQEMAQQAQPQPEQQMNPQLMQQIQQQSEQLTA